MTALKPAKPDESQAVAAVEGEIRDFVRRDLNTRKAQPEHASEDSVADGLNSLLDRAGRNSAKEIDKLIVELQQVRDYLKSEGDRVQREITKYVQVSQTAMASVKIISDSMGQWKSGGTSLRPDRA